MSDPIKAALAAAVDASFRHDGGGFPPPLHVQRERHWRVAHEIAAFLRAIDPHAMEHPEDMAAAVVRAAREAGDA